MAVCGFCGTHSSPDAVDTVDTVETADRAAAADPPPLTWVTSVENGKPRVYCADCARTHLRGIESKLDSEWW